MKDQKKQEKLTQAAGKIRRGILDATYAAASGHPGGSLGSADIFAYLYFSEMKIDPKKPEKPERDRFVLSKGHCAPGLYAALAHRGFFPVKDLQTLRKPGSHLQGHPSRGGTPGVDMSTGSLGQGISAACGMALGAKMSGGKNRVFALMGDGELAEGECWEAFLFAAHYKLDNLRVIIDVNGLQIDGATKDVLNTDPIDSKLQAFGFEVIPVNGNDFDSLEEGFDKANKVKGKPVALIAKTTKGKGVSFMENQASWHGKAPNREEYEKAVMELDPTAVFKPAKAAKATKTAKPAAKTRKPRAAKAEKPAKAAKAEKPAKTAKAPKAVKSAKAKKGGDAND